MTEDTTNHSQDVRSRRRVATEKARAFIELNNARRSFAACAKSFPRRRSSASSSQRVRERCGEVSCSFIESLFPGGPGNLALALPRVGSTSSLELHDSDCSCAERSRSSRTFRGGLLGFDCSTRGVAVCRRLRSFVVSVSLCLRSDRLTATVRTAALRGLDSTESGASGIDNRCGKSEKHGLVPASVRLMGACAVIGNENTGNGGTDDMGISVPCEFGRSDMGGVCDKMCGALSVAAVDAVCTEISRWVWGGVTGTRFCGECLCAREGEGARGSRREKSEFDAESASMGAGSNHRRPLATLTSSRCRTEP